MYDERFLTGMREELTRYGIEELRTSAAVDEKVKDAPGTTLVVVNSVCGCAARNARPAVATALQAAAKKPDHLYTVFAGQDIDATRRGALVLHRLCAELAVDRAVQGRQDCLHARTASDRRAFSGRDLGRSHWRVRQVRVGRDRERVGPSKKYLSHMEALIHAARAK